MSSTFEIFKLGVGPSSSHTMGPMTAAVRFLGLLHTEKLLGRVTQVTAYLYGSLALTGKGHATDTASMLGLMGYEPALLDPDAGEVALSKLREEKALVLGAMHPIYQGPRIAFDEVRHIVWQGDVRLPQHANAVKFSAVIGQHEALFDKVYYSIGGGFVLDDQEILHNAPEQSGPQDTLPYPFTSAAEMLAMAEQAGLRIPELMLANEVARRPLSEVEQKLDALISAMQSCIDRGMRQSGSLPGKLQVKRRAKALHEKLMQRAEQQVVDPMSGMDWVNVWALAVNEENAAGSRVVTAPTNGGAGVVPAVLRYYDRFCNGTVQGRRDYMLTAAAIAALYKRNASISGAAVGCQGEVGVACSMAAGGLAAALGGTNAQIENAAEIGMEHNLGLTCDPVGGLVQIPCIERNAMAAIKAIDAARLALAGDGSHYVSLDQVILTMKRTGEDMKDIYKETSLGGLAVNFVEC
ncbi:MAG: L-serine ammonia-lyase [Alphaproteobacteria bacterium]|nr:L-serine ammonia-lyase [Alphaproteobacteria bacterium]